MKDTDIKAPLCSFMSTHLSVCEENPLKKKKQASEDTFNSLNFKKPQCFIEMTQC